MADESREQIIEPTVGHPVIDPEEIVYENQHFRVTRFDARFDDYTKNFFVTDFGQRAGVVVTDGTSILLTRQYRLVTKGLSWEIPGGGMDPEESPEAGARRECLEETGVRCGRLKPLVVFQPGLDTVRNLTHIFTSSDYTQHEADRPEFPNAEVHSCHWISHDECAQMVSTGIIQDSFTLIGVLSFLNSIRR